MDEEIGSLKKSLGAMSLEQIQSKNSSFTRFSPNNNKQLNESIKSQMSVQGSKKSDIYDELIKSDNSKRQLLMSSYRSTQSAANRKQVAVIYRLNSSDDKNRFVPQVNSNISNQSLQDLKKKQITHVCTCKKFGHKQFCRQYCQCFKYNHQQCVQQKCCQECFLFKNMNFLPAQISQNANEQNNICKIQYRDQKAEDQNWQDYFKEEKVVQKKKPKVFKSDKCQCRNSLCRSKYCVCFTAGKKCNIRCMCQNCRNCEPHEYKKSPLQIKQQIGKPYLEDSFSGKSISDKMEFQPPDF